MTQSNCKTNKGGSYWRRTGRKIWGKGRRRDGVIWELLFGKIGGNEVRYVAQLGVAQLGVARLAGSIHCPATPHKHGHEIKVEKYS